MKKMDVKGICMTNKRFVTDWVDIIDIQTNEKYEPCLEKGLHKFLELMNEIVEERDVYKQYQKDVAEVLFKQFEFAENQANKNMDDVMVHTAYKLLSDSLILIAKEIGVELR